MPNRCPFPCPTSLSNETQTTFHRPRQRPFQPRSAPIISLPDARFKPPRSRAAARTGQKNQSEKQAFPVSRSAPRNVSRPGSPACRRTPFIWFPSHSRNNRGRRTRKACPSTSVLCWFLCVDSPEHGSPCILILPNRQIQLSHQSSAVPSGHCATCPSSGGRLHLFPCGTRSFWAWPKGPQEPIVSSALSFAPRRKKSPGVPVSGLSPGTRENAQATTCVIAMP